MQKPELYSSEIWEGKDGIGGKVWLPKHDETAE